MLTYLEALDRNISTGKGFGEKLLIWLAEINRNLPPNKRLGDTEIQIMADYFGEALNCFFDKKKK